MLDNLPDWRARPYTELDATADKPLMVFPEPAEWPRLLQLRIDRGWIYGRDGQPVKSLAELPPRAIPTRVDPANQPYVPAVRAGPPTKLWNV